MESQLAFAFASSEIPDRRAAAASDAATATTTPAPTVGASSAISPKDPRHPRRHRVRFGRYARRRRARPQPRPFLGHGAFRLVMRGAIPYIVGPAGRRCEQLTAWAREMLASGVDAATPAGARVRKASHDPLAETRRRVAAMDAIRMVVDAVSWVHAGYPKVLDDMLETEPTKAREVVLHWLRLTGCTLRKGKGRSGGRIVTPPSAADQWRISATLANLRKLFEFWREAGIRTGHNPMQMDPDRSRLGGERSRTRRSSTKWWLDVDSMFRVRHIGNQAPCPDDRLAAAKVLEAGRRAGWPEEVQLLYEGQYLTGARRGQLSVATAYGLLVAATSENHLALPQKGSGGELAWQARTPSEWRGRVLRMLARRVPGGMKELRRLAGSGKAADHDRLRRLYVFSPDGIAPIAQWRLDHLLRAVVERLGLTYRIARDDGTVQRRWFTSHWFRHMFIGRMLDGIAESALDASGRDAARTKLARYMGWAHPDTMLAYYGRRHFEREVDEIVATHQEELNAQVRAVLDGDDDHDAANDNAAWSTARVAGDLLA